MIYEAYFAAIALMGIGLFCVAFRSHLLKKIIGLGIFSNGLHIFFITMGYRSNSINPIVTPQNIQSFAQYSVDPVPQALVLTSIVIDMSVTALALIIIIWIYRRFGTADSNEMMEGRQTEAGGRQATPSVQSQPSSEKGSHKG